MVTKKVDDEEEERMITHLHVGHYFGELALIYDDPRVRHPLRRRCLALSDPPLLVFRLSPFAFLYIFNSALKCD